VCCAFAKLRDQPRTNNFRKSDASEGPRRAPASLLTSFSFTNGVAERARAESASNSPSIWF
jgi:hypothetical protein